MGAINGSDNNSDFTILVWARPYVTDARHMESGFRILCFGFLDHLALRITGDHRPRATLMFGAETAAGTRVDKYLTL